MEPGDFVDEEEQEGNKSKSVDQTFNSNLNDSSIKMLKNIEGHLLTLVTERKKQI